MADVTVEINKGGTYTSISSGLSQLISTFSFGGTDLGILEITDNSEYEENVDITGVSGTASITSHVVLRAATANKHSGVAGTGHARIRGTTAGAHVITVQEAFTYIHSLEIQQDSTTSDSAEGIRITSAGNDSLISRCIIWTDQTLTDQDGIYVPDIDIEFSVDNCVIYGFYRCGIHLQDFQTDHTQIANVDYCTIYDCGGDGAATDGGIHIQATSTGAVGTVNLRNTACVANTSGSATDYSEAGGGTAVWTGSNNADTDSTLIANSDTNAQHATSGVDDATKGSGSWALFDSIVGGSEDFNLLDASAFNVLSENGLDISASKADSRQDLTLDIAGTTRSTTTPAPDIGAFEFDAGGGAFTLVTDSGSYTYTGTATALTADRQLTTESGSYSYTGTAIDLNHGFYLATGSGAYLYSGTDIVLTFTPVGAFDLVVDSGSYAYTGTSVDLLRGEVLTTESGAYSYTGTNISLLLAATIATESGAYTYTGTTLALLATRSLATDSGSYTYSGTDVILDFSGQIWTIQSNESTSWSSQANETTVWSEQNNSSTVWTIQ